MTYHFTVLEDMLFQCGGNTQGVVVLSQINSMDFTGSRDSENIWRQAKTWVDKNKNSNIFA